MKNNTLGDFFDSIFEEHKDKSCIYFPTTEASYTYEAFQGYCKQFAKALIGMGFKKGDHIALKAFNSPEWIALQVGSAYIGVVLTCLNTAATQKELAYCMDHSNSKRLFTDYDEPAFNAINLKDSAESFLRFGEEVSDDELEGFCNKINPEDPITIQYTSGTTGNPKAVLSSNGQFVEHLKEFTSTTTFNPSDRLLLCMPLFHVMGCALSVFPIFITGGSIVIVERFKTSRVLELLESKRCTTINAVPTMYLYLMEKWHEYDLSPLKKGMIAGSRASVELMDKLMSKHQMTELFQVYGQTECLAVTQATVKDPYETKLTTVGRPLASIAAKIIDPETGEELPYGEKGELIIKTNHAMIGYYKNEKATKETIDEEGWLHTGDLACMDKDGYIQINCRIKDVIIRGGENISTGEIEEAVLALEDIKECSVVGVPDEYYGEEICLFYVSDKPCKQSMIRDYLKGKLSKYKIPKYMYQMDELPKTNSGKIKNFELKNTYKKLNIS